MKRILFAFVCLFIFFNSQSQNINLDSALKNFKGYKVDTTALNISKKNDFGKSYWLNTAVFSDIMVALFQKNYEVYAPPQGEYYCVFSTGICNGDFNNDGYIDVFNSGAAHGGKKANLSFLIWNPTTKKYEEKNLVNDKTNFLGNPANVIPMYLNADNFVDLIIIGGPDEGFSTLHPSPTTLCLSDGKGGYDLTNLTLEPDYLYNNNTHERGDAADVNGDGYPDLTIPTGPHTYIFWGTPNFPYFTNQNFAHFSSDTVNFSSNNGFGEVVPEGAGDVFASHFADINGDGLLDLFLGGSEDSTSNKHQRILLNQGKGKFNKNRLINLPFFTNIPNYTPKTNNGINQFHYVTDDLNGDGLMDIISLNATNYKYWYLSVYIQQTDQSFKIDTSWIVYNTHYLSPYSIWKFRLLYHDFNGDGKKDISYEDASIQAYTDSGNTFSRKTVFIRTGNSFVEKDFYQYDPYAKFILDSLKGKPNCPQGYLRKPIFNSFVKSFCPGDSVKVSMTLDLKIDNILKGDSLKWYYGTKSDLTNVSTKSITDSIKFFVIRKDSIGCIISSDTIQLSKYAVPIKPTIVWDGTQFAAASNSTGVKYQWLLSNSLVSGATSSNYKPTAIGSYKIQITDANGCKNVSDSFSLVVTAVNPSIETSADHIAKIAPNPASTDVTLNFKQKPNKTLTIRLLNLKGQVLKQITTNSQSTHVSLSEILSGNYIIEIIGKGYNQTQQLLITK